MRPKIAYLTGDDEADRKLSSGTVFYISQALRKYCGDVYYISPTNPASGVLKRLFGKTLEVLTGKRYLHTHTLSWSTKLARSIEEKLAAGSFDLVFAPMGSTALAALETTLPIVYLSDTTTKLMLDYYPSFSNLINAHEASDIEQRAIDKASLLLYPSSWAACSAQADYHADERKIHIVPFGANIDECPAPETLADRTRSDKCSLLFVGADWERKGGSVAYETLLELDRKGIPAKLTVVGSVPPKVFRHPNLEVIRFLNKNTPADRAHLNSLYLNSDFLLLPTRMDCSPIVICEANAFGLPVIASVAGGVPEIIRDGLNGYLLPPEARGQEYASLIAKLHSNCEHYRELRRSSREQFETRLNWNVWGKAVSCLIFELLQQSEQGRSCVSQSSAVS